MAKSEMRNNYDNLVETDLRLVERISARSGTVQHQTKSSILWLFKGPYDGLPGFQIIIS